MIEIKKVSMFNRGLILYSENGEDVWYCLPEHVFLQSLYSLLLSPIMYEDKRVGRVVKLYIGGRTPVVSLSVNGEIVIDETGYDRFGCHYILAKNHQIIEVGDNKNPNSLVRVRDE